ncbi:glycosyltransferase family 2 protein [Elusimicrobiota bacterium]
MKVSAIIPVYNEEDNLPQLHERLTSVLKEARYDYEIVFIEDGSSDRSYEVLCELSASDPDLKIVKFTRNYGQTAAMHAGFNAASGDVIVTLDADLQNNPEDIPRMIDIFQKENADVVSGWRSDRKDSLVRIFVSGIANHLISRICGLKLHDYGCTLKIYKAKYIKDLKLYGEMHRFIPAFIHWNGGTVLEMKVSHSHRLKGKSSYGMGRTHRVILDLITTKFLTTYSTKPIHVFGTWGIASIISGIMVFVYVAVRKVYMGGIWISPLFFMSIFFVGFGVIFIFMGIIAEILIRIYFSQGDNLPYRIDDNALQ